MMNYSQRKKEYFLRLRVGYYVANLTAIDQTYGSRLGATALYPEVEATTSTLSVPL